MKTNCDLVADFMRMGKQRMPYAPTMGAEGVAALRAKLIREETKEVCHAIEKKNLPALAKELADLLYVVYGAALAFGIPMNDVFQIVHQSNLTKFGPDGSLMKDASGKIVRGPFYRPAEPEIEQLFSEMIG